MGGSSSELSSPLEPFMEDNGREDTEDKKGQTNKEEKFWQKRNKGK